MKGIVSLVIVIFSIMSYTSKGELTAVRETEKSPVTFIELRVNGEVNPKGIDSEELYFSWKLASKYRNQYQTGYQILLYDEEADTPYWDSGKIDKATNIRVAYTGKDLESVHSYRWKVRVWDKNGEKSRWSNEHLFTTGLYDETEWKAQWISSPDELYAPLFLKEFNLREDAGDATVFVNCQGFFELYVNGKKVGTDILAPAVSDFRFENYYLTFDIGDYLQKGKNTIGLWTGQGWYSPGLPAVKHGAPVFRLQAHINVGANTNFIVSDDSWKTKASNLKRIGEWRWNNMGGELVDSRTSIQDWWNGETNESWQNAISLDAPEAVTSSQICKSNTVSEIISVKEISNIEEGVWLLDFGQNFTGWIKMNMQNQAEGDTVDFIYSDFCNKRPERTSKYKWDFGNKYIGQRDAYVFSGEDNGIFCPKFNYHAFRYVIVQGLNYKPKIRDIKGLMIESDLEDVGDFSSSDVELNAIYELNDYTFRCLNNGGYFVDCPHRERLGYGGDGQVAIETGIYSLELYSFYKKWAKNWLANQDKTGNFGHTAPAPYDAGGGPAWGGMGVVLPWKIYKYYGDSSFLSSSFEAMADYVDFLESKSEAGILKHYGHEKWGFIGDWLPPGKGMDSKQRITAIEKEVFNNCYKLYLCNILAEAAEVLEKYDEKEKYDNLVKQLSKTINRIYYDEKSGVYANGGQAYLSFPLLMNVPVGEDFKRVSANLENEIRYSDNGHLNTGMLGTYFMLQCLTEIGRSDLVYLMMKQKTFPGWGYMIEQGANTCWEQWNGHWSNIHACFTSGGGWFYTGVAGIRQTKKSVAFKHLLIWPQLTDKIDEQSTYFNSPYGRVGVAWHRKNNSELVIDIEVPVNTKADVILPVLANEKVFESGVLLTNNNEIETLEKNRNGLKVQVSSGNYKFTIHK